MVARPDLRPTRPDDSLKRFINGVKNSKTVPVGLKVAQADEGYVFYDSTQSAHPWNGDTIKTVNDRLGEASQIMAQTRADLEQTRLDLDAAEARIQASTGDLSVYESRIQATEQKVASTAAELDTVQDTLNTTSTDLAGLESRAGSIESALAQVQQDTSAAQQAASDASTDANEALAYAQQVKATADNAQATATSAESAARAASDAAATANNKALEAAGLASAAGRVIYGSTAPTAVADQQSQNLWINTATNAPNRWDGSKWVVVTDKAATDAAAVAASAQAAASTAQSTADTAKANAATAQSTADKAVKDAAAAASTAQAAQVAAGNAQKTADGKTVVQYGTVTPPPNPGVVKGDVYFYTGTDNRIIEQWQWSGTAWVKRKIESAQLANFDAGYITSGYLDVLNRIKAGAIFADKLTVGLGDNILPNGAGQAKDGWGQFEWVSTAQNGFPGAFKVLGYKIPLTDKFPASPGNYRFAVDVKGEGDGQKFYIAVNAYDLAGNTLGTVYTVTNQLIPNGVWQRFTSNIVVPGGTSHVRIAVFSQHQLGVQDPTKYVWYTGFSLREMKDGALIVNGSITGDKVNGQSVAGVVGQFVKVQATNVEVTGELASRVAQFMDASAKKLVVSEEAILQHTTLLGTTVANELNVTKLLRGKDAIIDGTLDVAQLNVTETMAAEIARFMSVETKRAVVSEDAILQRATVIENIVTPELIANKANIDTLGGRLITGGTLQTSTAPNAGVKITSEGYKAFDAAGNLAVNLDGKNNLIVGSFATSTQASSGVKISQGSTIAAIDLYTPNWGGNTTTQNSHGGIWYEIPSTLAYRGLNIFATDSATVGALDPGIMLQPAGSEINFQGKFGTTGNAFKKGTVNGTNVAGGGWWTMNVTYPSPMAYDPAVFISPITDNNVECAIGIKNATRFGFTAVVSNQSPRESGNAYLKWIAMAI